MADFIVDTIDFARFDVPVASFEFGDDGAGRRLSFKLPLDPDVNIEEALAMAAENAATDFRAWAKDAEDFAARTRTGGLRQAPPTP